MQIPARRTPQTNVVAPQEGFARPAQPLDFSPITNTIREYADELEKERKTFEAFDLNKRLLAETNALQQDYAEREQNEPLGAAGFTQRVLEDYEKRHNSILDEYWKQGYSQEAVQDFALRLGSLRENFGEKALAFQTGSLKVASKVGLEEHTLQSSQYATTNPDGYASAIAENDLQWDQAPGLDAIEREEGKRQSRSIIRQGAAKGLALQNPQLVIDLLDPRGFTAPAAGANIPGAAGGSYGILGEWQGEVGGVLSQKMSAPVVAGFLGNFDVEGGHSGARGDNGTAAGLAQWRGDRRQNFISMFGKEPDQASLAEQAQFVQWEMDNPERAGMTVEQRDAILAADTPAEAAELIDRYYERSSGEHRSRRVQKAEEYAQRASAPMVDASGLESVPLPPSNAEQAPDPSTLTPANENTQVDANLGPVQHRTGNAILDDLNGAERLQALAWARETQTRRTVQVSGAMDVAIDNAVTGYMTQGEYGGPEITREKVIAAYPDNPVKAEQQWGRYEKAQQAGQAIQRFKTASLATIERDIERLRPNPASPTLETDTRLYEAAVSARDAIVKAREDDPAAYVFQAFPELAREAEAADTSQERAALYGKMIEAYDRLGVPREQRWLMTETQIEALGNRYNSASPAERVAILEQTMTEMRPVTAGYTLGRAAGEKVAEDFALFAILRQTPNYRGTLARVFAGRDIIAKDPARKPSPAVINKTFAGTGGLSETINVLDPDVSRMINEAAAALYVQRGGRTENGVVTQSIYAQALREALGGVGESGGFYDDKKGAVKEFTILPPGVTRAQFEAWQERLQPGGLTRYSVNGKPPVYRNGQPVPLADILDDGVFVMRYPGVYGIKMASDGKFLADSSGRAFEVRIDRGVVAR